jgi:diguanylate cyclase (GGDEF)-like protein/hemerythrin-like metal-binding protein
MNIKTPGLFDGFMNFPAPLLLTNAEGHAQLANTQFTDRFGSATPDRPNLLIEAKSDYVTVQLSGVGAEKIETSARVIRMRDSMLLIFATIIDAGSETLLTRLQNRVAELERIAACDHLTGAWNRAHLDCVIHTELARSITSHQPLSLVLFDIDHFKHINDTFGHAIGDAVLRELVKRMNARVRSSDVLFRWGGEEFVVLVASAGYRNAEVVAENLRRAIAEHPFETVGTVTISVGVAECVQNENAEAWFRRLDAALYKAKNAGRNRVVVDRRGNSDIWANKAGSAALHLIWQEGYECGEPTIDDEHRELFQLANVLLDVAMRGKSDHTSLYTALSALLEHIEHHFADEESILVRHRYCRLEQHKRAHAGLLRRARELKARFEQGKAGLGDIVDYLAQDVVARHILAVDRAFFPLFSLPETEKLHNC